MHYTQEFLNFIEKMKIYCRIKGTQPGEGTILVRLPVGTDIIYKINTTSVVFSPEMIKELKLDEYGVEITLKS